MPEKIASGCKTAAIGCKKSTHSSAAHIPVEEVEEVMTDLIKEEEIVRRGI